MRRASETNIPDSTHLSRGSPALTSSQPSSAISPTSPTGGPSPPSMLATKAEDDKDSAGNYMDFTPDSGAYESAETFATAVCPIS